MTITCPSNNDLALSKLCAWREKDKAWLVDCANAGLVDLRKMKGLAERITDSNGPGPAEIVRRLEWVAFEILPPARKKALIADNAGGLPDPRALLRMGRAMVDLYCASFKQVPKRIVLDIDDTFDAVHGGQQLRLFNAHHDDYGFQPIVVFDGDGRFVTCVLRPARRPGEKEIKPFLRRLLRAIRSNWSGPQ